MRITVFCLETAVWSGFFGGYLSLDIWVTDDPSVSVKDPMKVMIALNSQP